MLLDETKLKQVLTKPLTQSVFYITSTEEYLVRSYAAKTIALLQQAEEAETTRVEGPAPDVEEIVAAAGTISMFGTKRIVEVPLLSPSAMNEADVTALCDIMQSLENAVLVITTVWPDDKAKLSKKAKQLLDAAQGFGVAAELVKPRAQDAKSFVTRCAAKLQTQLSPPNADVLVERCGTDYFTLEQEVAKLAAAAGYTEITRELIQSFGTQNVEADVFEMVRMVTARQTGRALSHLQRLLELQNEPIAIAAALSGSFVDMYRVKCGGVQKRSYGTVHKDFKYRGSDYRLKKSSETASSYTQRQLEAILEILCMLDTKLKSSAVSGVVLLQTALCQIAAAGGKA